VIPKLFQIGPISFYSFGMMMGIAFIVGGMLLSKELGRKKLSADIGSTITLIALFGGLLGAKLFDLLENPDEFKSGIFHALFSPAGLTYYGGLIVAILLIYVYVKSKKLSFLRIADAAAPALIIAYGIGRIGCQLAGDGDYGIPTKLPWGMTYAKGTAKPTVELLEYFQRNPGEDSVYHYSEYRMIRVGQDEFGPITKFDESVHLHPAPLYELLYSILIFLFLWSKRKVWDSDVGKLFGVYLILQGLTRFLIEFIRLNPLYYSLSLSQWIGLAAIIVGGVLILRKKNVSADNSIHIQLLTKENCSLCDEMKLVLNAQREQLGFDYEVIKIHERDKWWDAYWDKVPVLMANGKLFAKYKITEEELRTRIGSLRNQSSAENVFVVPE